MLWRDPNLLWLLLGVLGVAVVLIAALRRRGRQLRAFAEADLVARLAPDVAPGRRAWRAALRIAALALLVVALAGPKWGFHWEEVKREGIDLIVAIDTSRSMLATDVKPDRLERAKLAVMDLVQLLKGDRIGLVPFAGTAFLECPLTLDYAAFERSLRSVQVGLIPRGGTALARAIETSLDGFEAHEGRHEALILITDGEDHEGDVEKAAQAAAEHGVEIFTVGIGTEQGELIPVSGVGQRLRQGPQRSGGQVAAQRGGAGKDRLGDRWGLCARARSGTGPRRGVSRPHRQDGEAGAEEQPRAPLRGPFPDSPRLAFCWPSSSRAWSATASRPRERGAAGGGGAAGSQRELPGRRWPCWS